MADSKRLLADALTGLMECKPLDQVRVAEIAAAAGVSKQTFYHHFSDKYHLMEYCFRDMFAAPFERMGTLAPFDECYIEFLQLCHERKTFLRNAFTSQDVNSLYRVMHHALRDAYGARVHVFGVLDQGETGFCLDFFSKGCAGCTRHWFDQGMDFEDAELVGLIRQCIPVGVARFFEEPALRGRSVVACVADAPREQGTEVRSRADRASISTALFARAISGADCRRRSTSGPFRRFWPSFSL